MGIRVRLLLTIVPALLLVVTSLPRSAVQAQSAPDALLAADVAPDRLLVKFKAGTPAADKENAKRNAGARAAGTFGPLDIEELELAPGRLVAAYQQLLHNPHVEYVTPDHIVYPAYVPADPYYSNGSQWAPAIIQAPTAWDESAGQGVIVAVADSGVDPNHPDLRERLVPGYNFYTEATDTPDGCGHGTHVAGIVAATANSEGVIGIAHASSIMPLKSIADNCSGTVGKMARAILYAADNGARVIVISSGTTEHNQVLLDMITYARSKGLVVVAAAGNNNSSAPFYPASYPEVIAVSATDSNDARYAYSNYGSQIDIAAPGKAIYSTYYNSTSGSTYAAMSGTSMAAPHVAAVAAMAFAKNPFLSATEVEQLLTASADDLGDPGVDPYFGYGRLNAARVVAAVPTNGVHIGDLDSSGVVQRKNWRASVDVAVQDRSDLAVPGATIHGVWSGGYSGTGSCVTGNNGRCIVTSGTANTSISITFEVTEVTHPIHPYRAQDNRDPDGDSDGTKIIGTPPKTSGGGGKGGKHVNTAGEEEHVVYLPAINR